MYLQIPEHERIYRKMFSTQCEALWHASTKNVDQGWEGALEGAHDMVMMNKTSVKWLNIYNRFTTQPLLNMARTASLIGFSFNQSPPSYYT